MHKSLPVGVMVEVGQASLLTLGSPGPYIESAIGVNARPLRY